MTQRSYPFDAGAGSAIVEADWQRMARRWLASGVITGYLNQLLVTADGTSLAVSVASGGAWIEGFYYETDAAVALTIAAANATNPRRDVVVARLDTGANTVTLAVLTGTPSPAASAPTPTQTDALWEIPLATVLVDAAVGVIAAGKVTDSRTLTQNLTTAAADAAYQAKTATQAAFVAVSESTASASYTDLTTAGPAVAIATGTRALVTVTGSLSNGTANADSRMGFAVSGATTVAATDAMALIFQSSAANQQAGMSATFLVTGLTAGTNTFTSKYRANGGGTASFGNRRLTVIAL